MADTSSNLPWLRSGVRRGEPFAVTVARRDHDEVERAINLSHDEEQAWINVLPSPDCAGTYTYDALTEKGGKIHSFVVYATEEAKLKAVKDRQTEGAKVFDKKYGFVTRPDGSGYFPDTQKSHLEALKECKRERRLTAAMKLFQRNDGGSVTRTDGSGYHLDSFYEHIEMDSEEYYVYLMDYEEDYEYSTG